MSSEKLSPFNFDLTHCRPFSTKNVLTNKLSKQGISIPLKSGIGIDQNGFGTEYWVTTSVRYWH